MQYNITVNYNTINKDNEPLTITVIDHIIKDTNELVQEYIQNTITNGEGTIEIYHNQDSYVVNRNTGVVISVEEQTN